MPVNVINLPDLLLTHAATDPAPAASVNNPTINNFSTASTAVGGTTYGGTVRVEHQTGNNSLASVAAVLVNISTSPNSGGEIKTNLSIVTVNAAAIEYNGVSYSLTFNGQPGSTVQPGCKTVTDFVRVHIPANTVYYLWLSYSIAAGGNTPPLYAMYPGVLNYKIYSNTTAPPAANLVGQVGTANLTANQSPLWGTSHYMIGRSDPATIVPCISLVGDSITFGVGSNNGCQSAAFQAAVSNGFVAHNLGLNGETMTVFTQPANSITRMDRIANTHIIWSGMGINDVRTLALSFAAMKALYIQYWTMLGSSGQPVWQTTLTPTVSYSTNIYPVSSQTRSASNAVRQQVNAWLRAPASAGAGYSALADYPALAGIIDVASTIETDSTNSAPGGPANPNTGGYYYCGPGNNVAYSVDGVHPSPIGYTAMTAAYALAVSQAGISAAVKRIYP